MTNEPMSKEAFLQEFVLAVLKGRAQSSMPCTDGDIGFVLEKGELFWNKIKEHTL